MEFMKIRWRKIEPCIIWVTVLATGLLHHRRTVRFIQAVNKTEELYMARIPTDERNANNTE
jgi:hypothetical protein